MSELPRSPAGVAEGISRRDSCQGFFSECNFRVAPATIQVFLAKRESRAAGLRVCGRADVTSHLSCFHRRRPGRRGDPERLT